MIRRALPALLLLTACGGTSASIIVLDGGEPAPPANEDAGRPAERPDAASPDAGAKDAKPDVGDGGGFWEGCDPYKPRCPEHMMCPGQHEQTSIGDIYGHCYFECSNLDGTPIEGTAELCDEIGHDLGKFVGTTCRRWQAEEDAPYPTWTWCLPPK
jgi:hypothetical protein